MTWCNIVNLCEPQISWGAQHQVEALQKAAGLRDQAGRVLDIMRSGDAMGKKATIDHRIPRVLPMWPYYGTASFTRSVWLWHLWHPRNHEGFSEDCLAKFAI
jgi:hypothetical protein